MKMKKKLLLLLTLAILPCSSNFAQMKANSISEKGKENSIQHKTVKVIDGKASIVLPVSFEKMTEQQINDKYASANPKPKEIWYLDTGKSIITLSFTMPFPDKKLIDEHVPKLAEMMKRQMADLKPVLTTKKVNGLTVSRLETVAKDASGNGTTVYSILQLSSFNDRLLMTTFNVSAQLKDKYYSTGEVALDSLTY